MLSLLPKRDMKHLFNILLCIVSFLRSERFEIGVLAAGMLVLVKAAVLAHSSHPRIHNAWFAWS